MTDATAEFFDALVERGHEPLLEKATGTVRFDLKDGKKTDRWLVAIVKGDLAVSRQNLRADCVVSADKALFDDIASGKTNAMAALLRGAMSVEGDIQLLVLFQRLLPGPPALPKAAPHRGSCEEETMSNGLVQILDGNTFVVSDSNGDIEASLTDPTGLFSFDTRFLSKWVLTIDGQRLNALSVDDLQYFETRFFLVPGIGNRLRRRQALRHPAARGRERLPRGADHPQPRRQAGRPRRPHRGRLGLRRPLRGQGRAREEGEVLRSRRTRTASPRL